MRILITGGKGFLAQSIVESLSERYQIEALGRDKLDLLQSDDVSAYLKRHRFDVVIHAATYDAAHRFTTKDPTKVLENNLKMFFHLVRCREHFGKMIYFGSGAEFGREHWTPKMREQFFDQHVPVDQYGLSKYIMTQYALHNENIYNLRLFGVYGKYDDWRYRLIPNLCCLAACGLPLRIHQNKVYDYVYIDDLMRILPYFIEKTPRYPVYNICSGVTYEFKEIAGKIIELSGQPLDIVFDVDGYGVEYSGDNTLLTQEIPELIFTEMRDSLRYLLNWFTHHVSVSDLRNPRDAPHPLSPPLRQGEGEVGHADSLPPLSS